MEIDCQRGVGLPLSPWLTMMMMMMMMITLLMILRFTDIVNGDECERLPASEQLPVSVTDFRLSHDFRSRDERIALPWNTCGRNCRIDFRLILPWCAGWPIGTGLCVLFGIALIAFVSCTDSALVRVVVPVVLGEVTWSDDSVNQNDDNE